MNEIVKWILYFFIYAFLGWVCEVIYCSIPTKKFVNRGFLYMPICPIYGFGGVAVLLALSPFSEHWYLVLIIGILITTLLEYLTSFIMEKLFKMRWWDYSHYRFNIKGRVCLLNSLLFGGLCMIMVYLIHPLTVTLISHIKYEVQLAASTFLVAVLVADTILSVIAVGKLNTLLEKLKNTKEDIIENYDGKLRKYIYAHFIKKFPKLKSITNNHILEKIKAYILEKKDEIVDKIDEVKEKYSKHNDDK